MMLFLDTTDAETTSIYLLDKHDQRSHTWSSARTQSETLHQEIKKFLKKNRVTFQQLNKVGVVTGPGHFSRTRTGVVVANTLGYALAIPVVGVKKNQKSLDLRKIFQQTGQKSVKAYYAKPPNISQPKPRKYAAA